MTRSKKELLETTHALRCLYQPVLADRACVNVNTVRDLAKMNADAVSSCVETPRKVQADAEGRVCARPSAFPKHAGTAPEHHRFREPLLP